MQEAVIQAFKDYPSERLKLQCAYMYSIFCAILASGGEIDYKLPHEGQRKRKQELGIFEDPSCSEELYLGAKEHINRLSNS